MIQWENKTYRDVLIMNDKMFVKKKYINEKLKSIQLVFGKGAENLNFHLRNL